MVSSIHRHGTLSLYAALNTKTGEVIGKTAQRHTSEEFVGFLSDLLVHQPRNKEIHVIVDNLSAHKTERVKQFLTLQTLWRNHNYRSAKMWQIPRCSFALQSGTPK
jgi:hypothetical protein